MLIVGSYSKRCVESCWPTAFFDKIVKKFP
jgi:hypothetical protein